MNNVRPISVDIDLVDFLKDVADEHNATISSVANYYLRLAIVSATRPSKELLQERSKRGRKKSVSVSEVTTSDISDDSVVSMHMSSED